VQHVVVDANVLVSFITSRIEQQRESAKALLVRAADGELTAIVPQFVVFETTFVVVPGVLLIDDCPWKRVLDLCRRHSIRSRARPWSPSPQTTDTTR